MAWYVHIKGRININASSNHTHTLALSLCQLFSSSSSSYLAYYCMYVWWLHLKQTVKDDAVIEYVAGLSAIVIM